MNDFELRTITASVLCVLGILLLVSAARYHDLVHAVLAFALAMASYLFWRQTNVKS